MSRTSPLFTALLVLGLASASFAQDYGSRGNLGANASMAERAEIEALYERFIPYIDRARTELTMSGKPWPTPRHAGSASGTRRSGR